MVAGRLKLELSQYRELEAFAQFGSELDVDTQRTLARGERLVKMLNQKEREPLPVEDQVIQVYAATNGYLDRITVDKVDEFLEGLTQRTHAEQQELRGKLATGEWDDELEGQVDKAVQEFADDFGYDLDEEGLPLEEPETGDVERLRREAGAQAGDGDGAAPEAVGEEAPEEEPATV
jgi:F-type H+/Na+-transporting ATPase subunit alpha